mmetsp:Transcript_147186/g.410008  ORF Transcript_147186/g.410008 Transcript_147186/m.410008 type:complete len:333 (-) Transcript_147186:559-1557(-)
MALAQGSHSTGLVNCLFRSSTISCGLVPGFTGAPVAFMYTETRGGFMLGSSSSSALPSFSCAGFMSGVWKAPEVLITLACNAPAWSASCLSCRTEASVPAQEKPLGKSSLAIWQVAPAPSSLAAFAQSSMTLGLSRPATDSIACLPIVAASCITSPRSFTSFSPSSKLKTPATQSAVYSPSERPATAWQRVTASSRCSRSFSTPARPAMNMAGWQFRVSSSASSGPLRHKFRISLFRIVLAFASISRTLGRSLTMDIIFTYCEPCPGNRSPMGSGFSAGAAAMAAASSSSSSSSGSASSPPYFAGSSPCFLAAPGRLRYQPLAGALPHSQQL